MKIINQQGYTLVELLVAAALGILMLSVVLAIFMSSNTSFVATQGIAKSQETTRFAVSFLKRDIRLSGFRDCAGTTSTRLHLDDAVDSFPPSIENGIFGWEFNGTDAGDSYTLAYDDAPERFTQADITRVRSANKANADQWSGNFIQGAGNDAVLNLPALIAGFEPLRGSDILSMSIAEPLATILQLQANQRATELNIVDVAGNPEDSGIDEGKILQVSDCSAVDIFQNTAADDESFVSLQATTGGLPGNSIKADFQWQKKWGRDATLYETTTKVYYVGTGAGGKPSLFVYETNCGFAAGCGANQAEVVEGVENMQVLYGEDIDQDGSIDRYLSADNVTDFRGVKSVKVSLLVRSNNAGSGVASNQTYRLNGEIAIAPPAAREQRFVNTTTVFLHNRGL